MNIPDSVDLALRILDCDISFDKKHSATLKAIYFEYFQDTAKALDKDISELTLDDVLRKDHPELY